MVQSCLPLRPADRRPVSHLEYHAYAEMAERVMQRIAEEAASRFGVPSFVVDDEVFWGADAIEFLNAYLSDKAVLRNDEMRRVDNLPVGAAR